MLIHIDSSFTQFNENDNLNEVFKIPINNSNIQTQQAFTTSTPILMYFTWIDDSDNVPIIPIDRNKCIITNFKNPNKINVYNYFYGLPIVFQGMYSTITEFDNKTNVITCNDSIFASYFFEHLATNDSNLNEFIVSCKIVNPSFSNNERAFFLLGTNYKNIASNYMIVENTTKGWTSPIKSVKETYVILEEESLPYDSTDHFIVYTRDSKYKNNRSFQYKTGEILSLSVVDTNRTLYGFEVTKLLPFSETTHYLSLFPKNDYDSQPLNFYILKVDYASSVIYFTDKMDDIVNLNLLEYTPVITGYNSIRCNLDLNLNLIYSYNTLYLKLKVCLYL